MFKESGKVWIILIIYIISASSGAEVNTHVTDTPVDEDSTRNTSSSRNPRILLLNLVSPLSAADSCDTTSGLVGSCLSSPECAKKGGRGVETCAWGLGVCCVYTATCDETTSANMTYFISPNYPNTGANAGVCSVSIRPKIFSNICQLRLDFEDFSLAGPNPETGLCSTDQFGVSGQDLNNIVPVICGQNTGQHMYVDVGSSSGPFRLTVTTTGDNREKRWKIRITQIECGSGAMAPAHCLQYLTGPVGRVRSFGYVDSTAVPGSYTVNLNYAVCIRKEAGMCGATFTRDGNFGVTVASSGNTCTQGDFLSIGTTRVCGANTDVPDVGIRHVNTGPMILTFISDGIQEMDDIGFSFRYTQFACSVG